MTVSLEAIKWLPPFLKKEKTVFNGNVNLGKVDKEG